MVFEYGAEERRGEDLNLHVFSTAEGLHKAAQSVIHLLSSYFRKTVLFF